MDNKELNGANEKEFTSDDRGPLIFDFDGEATLKKDRKLKRSINLEVIRELNSELSDISSEIKNDIKSKLPPGAEINVDIEFSRGSIEWIGIIAISDWMARLADNISFVEYVIKAVRFSINKIVRGRIEQRAPIQAIHTNVTRRIEDDPFHPVTRFLWWSSGAVIEILRKSRTDKAKYEGIGGAILTTGILAFFSGFYAMYTMFEGDSYRIPLGILFGIIWALAIFNLDRYIVSSMKKEMSHVGNIFVRFLRELIPAFPRLLFAVIIGITISKPLEVRLFQRPIDEQININRDKTIKEKEASVRETYAQSVSEIDEEVGKINSDIQAKEDRAKYLEDEFHKESDSTGGSGKYGYSTVARLKEKAANDAKKETESLQLSTKPRREYLQLQKDGIENEIQRQLTDFKQNLGSDFFTRMRALSDLTGKYASVWWANYFIIFLLILIEATPVLVKLLSPLGPYDVKLYMRNDVESKEAEYKRNAMNAIAQYHYQRIIDGERHAEDAFFDMRNDLRVERLRQAFNQWRTLNFNGQGATFDELHDFIKDNVFTNRNT